MLFHLLFFLLTLTQAHRYRHNSHNPHQHHISPNNHKRFALNSRVILQNLPSRKSKLNGEEGNIIQEKNGTYSVLLRSGEEVAVRAQKMKVLKRDEFDGAVADENTFQADDSHQNNTSLVSTKSNQEITTFTLCNAYYSHDNKLRMTTTSNKSASTNTELPFQSCEQLPWKKADGQLKFEFFINETSVAQHHFNFSTWNPNINRVLVVYRKNPHSQKASILVDGVEKPASKKFKKN